MAAVIYEVNVDVDPDVAIEYENWLVPHIKEVNNFKTYEWK